jgi:hypothetical protein
LLLLILILHLEHLELELLLLEGKLLLLSSGECGRICHCEGMLNSLRRRSRADLLHGLQL